MLFHHHQELTVLSLLVLLLPQDTEVYQAALALLPQNSSRFSCSKQEHCAVTFPALFPLMNFTSSTRSFFGMKVQGLWQKQRGNKLVMSYWWHLTNSANFGNSRLHEVSCAEAVSSKQVNLYGLLQSYYIALVKLNLVIYYVVLGF